MQAYLTVISLGDRARRQNPAVHKQEHPGEHKMAVKVNAAVGVSAGHTSGSFSTGQHGADRKAQRTRAAPAATYDVNIRNGLYATRLRMRRPFRCVVYDHC